MLHMRTLRTLLAGVLTLSVGVGLSLVPATAATGSHRTTASTSSDDGMMIVGSPEQPFEDRVEDTVRQNPQLAARAEATLSQLRKSAEVGNNLDLPGSPGSTSQDLKTLERAEVATAKMSKQSAPEQEEGPAPLSGPTDFEVRGYETNNSRSWFVRTALDGAFCANDCKVTDRIRTNWTITPGRTGDRFSFTSTYTGSNFSNIYADIYVLCSGSVCADGTAGASGARDGNGSGRPVLRHRSQAGKSTVDRVRMRATFNPNGTRYYDGVLTGTARCRTGENYDCIF